MQQIHDFLIEWNAKTDTLGKLQGAYGVLALASLLIAGIVGLIQYNLGQSLLFLAVVFALIFIANGVVWSIMQTFFIPRYKKPIVKITRKK